VLSSARKELGNFNNLTNAWRDKLMHNALYREEDGKKEVVVIQFWRVFVCFHFKLAKSWKVKFGKVFLASKENSILWIE
jgi:hypothetical protein